MSDIEWTDETWNPVTGCTKVSPGCAHCYAETFAERFRGVPGHPFEQGFDLKLWPERLTKPFTWKKPRKVFVNSMSDLFHEDVPFEFIDRVFAVMALTPQHVYQVLTKRPERMREYLATNRAPMDVDREAFRMVDEMHLRFEDAVLGDFRWPGWPLPNVWLGVSAENQWWADVRIPELLATPAAVRFLSCEPLLGPLGFAPLKSRKLAGGGHEYTHYLTGTRYQWDPSTGEDTRLGPGIDWVIVGGESGPRARPFDLAWARSIVAQCRAAGVACFYKQGGKSNRCPHSSKGGCFECFPDDLKVREMPHVG